MAPLLLAAALLGEATAPPASLDEIIDRASRWAVAIVVERSKDLPASPFQPRRISPEGRSFYQRPAGCVTGILLDEEGNVLTSHYNVAGELKSIRVILASGDSRPAKLVAASPQDDAALLRIDGGGKPAGFSPPLWAGGDGGGEPRAGQLVFVLGRSPDPARVTVTRGIVSAARRNGGRAIQTDADLNYGNSGGPILDLEGRIVAMAGFIGHTQPQWGLNSGVGFGVSASVLREILPRLEAGENVAAFRGAFLGVQCDPGAISEAGTRVVRVVPESAAAKAGLRAGDFILELDGTAIFDFDHLRRLVFGRKPDDKIRLKVRRGEETLSLEAVLGTMPSP